MSGVLLIGMDIGGTSTRVTVTGSNGERAGFGTASGGNPTSHGGAAAATAIRTALGQALTGLDPSHVRAGVVGLAGFGRFQVDPAASAAFHAAWAEAGLDAPVRVVADSLVAFVAGTEAASGTVLVGGTGAVAAAVADRELGRIADGHGWLLGDLGGGYWIGREAVRATLAAVDAGRPSTPLTRHVLTEILGHDRIAPVPRHTVNALVGAVNLRPPVELARYAPLVTRAHEAGDPVATDIVTRAAAHLVDTVAAVRHGDPTAPIVLAGSVVTGDTAVAVQVKKDLSARWPAAPLCPARDGAAAAAWLAALDLGIHLPHPAAA